VPNSPRISAERGASPPRKSTTSRGSTGMMMPSASMSSSTVMKMNPNAARLDGGGGECVWLMYR
jgi:hypothetical protein